MAESTNICYQTFLADMAYFNSLGQIPKNLDLFIIAGFHLVVIFQFKSTLCVTN